MKITASGTMHTCATGAPGCSPQCTPGHVWGVTCSPLPFPCSAALSTPSAATLSWPHSNTCTPHFTAHVCFSAASICDPGAGPNLAPPGDRSATPSTSGSLTPSGTGAENHKSKDATSRPLVSAGSDKTQDQPNLASTSQKHMCPCIEAHHTTARTNRCPEAARLDMWSRSSRRWERVPYFTC